jgi:hypothetical protein
LLYFSGLLRRKRLAMTERYACALHEGKGVGLEVFLDCRASLAMTDGDGFFVLANAFTS